jgi:hypothetical protein
MMVPACTCFLSGNRLALDNVERACTTPQSNGTLCRLIRNLDMPVLVHEGGASSACITVENRIVACPVPHYIIHCRQWAGSSAIGVFVWVEPPSTPANLMFKVEATHQVWCGPDIASMAPQTILTRVSASTSGRVSPC